MYLITTHLLSMLYITVNIIYRLNNNTILTYLPYLHTITYIL